MQLGCNHANQGRGREGCSLPGTYSERGALPEQRVSAGVGPELT